MDDDKEKNVIEKLVDKINDAVESIATTASDALQQAMEPEPVKPDEQPIAYMPMAGDGLLDPAMPAVVIIPRRKKPTSKKGPKRSAKKAAKKTAEKSAKKGAEKKSPTKKKKASKAWKPAAGRKTVAKKKIAKKKKKAKKSRGK